MEVGVGRRRGAAEGIEAAIGDVAVTVDTVHRDAKLDVIGIPFSLGNLRLRGGGGRLVPLQQNMPSGSRQPEALSGVYLVLPSSP